MVVKSLKDFGPKAANPKRKDAGKGTNLLASLATTCPCAPGHACKDHLQIPAGTDLACILFEGERVSISENKPSVAECADPQATLGTRIKEGVWPLVRKYEAEPRKFEVIENEDGSIDIYHYGQCVLGGAVVAPAEEGGEATVIEAVRYCKVIKCKQYQAYVIPGADAFDIQVKDEEGTVLGTTTIDPSGLTDADLTDETATLIQDQINGDLVGAVCKDARVICVAASFIVQIYVEHPNVPCVPGVGKTPDAPLDYCYSECEEEFVQSEEQCNTEEGQKAIKKLKAEAIKKGKAAQAKFKKIK